MKFWNFIKNKEEGNKTSDIELRISGDIVDDDMVWIYDWLGEPCAAPNVFRDELKEFKGKDLTVWIDSYGGSVFAAAGIYTALKEHDGEITIKIDSKAMSAGSVIAMAGDLICMSPPAILMIHNPLTTVTGDMRELRKVAQVLDEIKETIINAYVAKTGKPREEIAEMMDDETYMSANTALKHGFADEILYNEGSPANDVEMQFNRLAVFNATNTAIQKFLDNETKSDQEKEKLLLQIDLI